LIEKGEENKSSPFFLWLLISFWKYGTMGLEWEEEE